MLNLLIIGGVVTVNVVGGGGVVTAIDVVVAALGFSPLGVHYSSFSLSSCWYMSSTMCYLHYSL